MFVGHYGPALALAGGARGPSLATACVAAQLVDYGWATFILTGVEKAAVRPGLMAMSPLDLFYMPYTHSLPGALAWAIGAAALYAAITRRGGMAALLVGVCVFSHWLADLLVHRPDLGLWGDAHKVGLGWWDNPVLGVGSELVVLTLGLLIYLRRTTPNGRRGAWAPWAFFAFLLILAVVNWFGPAPASAQQVAIMALVSYTVVAAAALGLDRTRRPAAPSPSPV